MVCGRPLTCKSICSGREAKNESGLLHIIRRGHAKTLPQRSGRSQNNVSIPKIKIRQLILIAIKRSSIRSLEPDQDHTKISLLYYSYSPTSVLPLLLAECLDVNSWINIFAEKSIMNYNMEWQECLPESLISADFPKIHGE